MIGTPPRNRGSIIVAAVYVHMAIFFNSLDKQLERIKRACLKMIEHLEV
jgi:hypothetical protein